MVKPTGLLADYTQTKKNETVLLGDIQKHLLDESLKPSDRRADIIHPSEMAKADWCIRQTYYRLAETAPSDPGRKFSFQLESIFDEGHTIHHKWQSWLKEMGLLWGIWECLRCEATWEGFSEHNVVGIPVNHSAFVRYKEVPLESTKYQVAGHADGAIPDANALIEIKSIGMGTLRMEEPALLAKHLVTTTDGRSIYDLDALWKGLRRPLASHLRQANVYLWLCREMGLPYDQMVFLYEYKANQSFKEFVVNYSPTIMEPLLDKVEVILYALRLGTPPPRPDFTGPDKKVCNECPYKTVCYGEASSAHSESDAGNGSGELRSEAPAREATPIPVESARREFSNSTEERNGVVRRSTDGINGSDSAVGELHSNTASSSGGRRKIRRSSSR